MKDIYPLIDRSTWPSEQWRRLEGRPEIKVLVYVQPINQTPFGRTWIIQAELSCAEGCPLETWAAER